MNRFTFACICAVALFAIVNSQTVTIREINPTHSNIGGMNATGGRINDLGRATDNIFYAASEFGGLFKSTDVGHSWTRLDNHLPTRVSNVQASPADPNLVVATSLYDGRVNSFAGINVSHDGGATWAKPATATPPTGFCSSVNDFNEPSAFGIAFDPEDTAHIFVGTNCGLAKSTDAGLTWTFINPGPNTSTRVFGVVVHDGGIIDTCGFGGHRRSINGGASWTGALSGGTSLPGAPFCSIAPSPDESNVLFATAGRRVFETDNGGGSWNTEFVNPKPQGRVTFLTTNKRQGHNFDLWFGDVEMFRASCVTPVIPSTAPRCPASSTWTVTGTGAHADMGDVAFTSPPPINVTVCRQNCTNEQTNCKNDCEEIRQSCISEIGQPGFPPHTIAQCNQQRTQCVAQCTTAFNRCNTNCSLFPEGCPVILASDGGTYTNTITGASACQQPKWIQSDVTTRGLWLWSLSGADIPNSLAREALYMAAQDDGSFATLDAGTATPNWVNPDCCDGFDTVADTTLVLYTICCFGPPPTHLFRRNPGMTGGSDITGSVPGNLPRFSFPDSIARFGVNRYALISDTGVFATQNVTTNPVTWTAVGTGAPTNACGLWAAGPVLNPTFYAMSGSCSGFSSNLMRHTGASSSGAWQNVPLPAGFLGVGVFAVDPNNPNRLFASILNNTGAHMLRSTDGGTNWVPDAALDALMTGNGTFRAQPFTLGYVQPTLVAFDPNNSNILLAGAADAGIFLSQNNGSTWTTLTNNSGGLANPIIPRPNWAYFDRECSQENIYIGTQGRGAWHLSFSDPNGVSVTTCQNQCESALTECQNQCEELRKDCIAEGHFTIAQCNTQRTQCRTQCTNGRNIQHAVQCRRGIVFGPARNFQQFRSLHEQRRDVHDDYRYGQLHGEIRSSRRC